MRKPFILAALLLVAACSHPTSQVVIPDDRPAIAVKNAPGEADLMIDGRRLGAISQYFVGPQVLRLEPGTHVVAVVHQGRTLLSEKMYLGTGNEIRTLTVPEGTW